MLKKEVAAQLMEHLCICPSHGYSWNSRYGEGGYCNVNIDGNIYYLREGDRDCSSGIIDAFETAGISCGGATYTGNMKPNMTSTGNFKWHPMSDGYIAQRGDVYLNITDHTAMCISAVPDTLAQFSISETGGTDGQEGDQTGEESNIKPYYDFPWDGILECINNETADGSAEYNVPEDTTLPNNVGSKGLVFTYAVKLEDGTILEEVQNLNDYAGIIGKKIIAIAIKCTMGNVKYQVHTINGEWLDYVTGYDWNDFDNGYAGDDENAIDAIRVVLSDAGSEEAQYRVSALNNGYYDWQYNDTVDNNQDGYAGEFGKAIDKFQIF